MIAKREMVAKHKQSGMVTEYEDGFFCDAHDDDNYYWSSSTKRWFPLFCGPKARRRFSTTLVNMIITIFLISALIITAVGPFQNLFSFQVEGLGKVLLENISEDHSTRTTYSLWSLGMAFPRAINHEKVMETVVIQITYFLFSGLTGILYGFVLLALWLSSEKYIHRTKSFLTFAHILYAWSSLDVFCISIILVCIELGVGNFVPCHWLGPLIAHFFPHEQNSCFRVSAELHMGAFLLLGASLVHLIVGPLVMRKVTRDIVIFEAVEREAEMTLDFPGFDSGDTSYGWSYLDMSQNGERHVSRMPYPSAPVFERSEEDSALLSRVTDDIMGAKAIVALKDEGANVNCRSVDGSTPLIIAVRNRRQDDVEALLTISADPLLCAANGDTALHVATKNGAMGITQLLLAHQADANQVNESSGDTCLHVAAKRGFSDILNALITQGQAFVDAHNIYTGDTTLISACREGNSEIVEHLLNARATAELANINFGETPMMIATQRGDAGIIRMLKVNEGYSARLQ